jgi:hypothetical protein
MTPPRAAAAFLALAMLAQPGAGFTASTWERARAVTKEEILVAMRAEQAQGYAIAAISNSVRLQTGVFFALAEQAKSADPERRPLRVGHAQYFAAFLEASGLQSATAPPFVTVPHAFGEDHLIDYRMENVIERVEAASVPLRALNVKAGWPARPDAPASYSYEHTSSQPHLETTHAQVNAYRILDFGNVVVYDEIRGVTGRATSGVLGFIFDLLGKARAVQTRFGVSPDGIQVSRTTAEKLLTITHTVTIYPDGRVVSGLPANRRDLAALETVLKALDLRVRYVPFDLSPIPVGSDAGR